MQVSVQKFTRTVVSTQLRLAERGNARPRKYGPLPKRAEPRAQFGGVQLRLLPGGEVPASVDLVEVDEVGVRLLRPAPRGLVDLVREDAHGDRDGDVLDRDVGALVPGQPLPVQARGGDPRV